ncbi:redoxin domain-containing protein [Candidatus Uhrbacteria bacterium]|nr:redoxin domain-containing protein [Candidatus Uhrbacteria bacterium]
MELYDEKIEKEIFDSKIPVLVEFYAEWCEPCNVMKSMIEELKKELEGKVKVIALNIETNPKLADKFIVLSLPTFTVYRDGKREKTLVGIQKKETLLSLLS